MTKKGKIGGKATAARHKAGAVTGKAARKQPAPGRKAPPAKAGVKSVPAKAGAKSVPAKAGAKAAASGAHKLSRRELAEYRARLVDMRERLSSQIDALKDDSLTRSDEVNTSEDGTDAFERQFALNIASSENHSLFEVDEALQRIDEGTYGQCEACGCLIEEPRLKALPFVRHCVKCQSAIEKTRGGRRAVAFDRG